MSLNAANVIEAAGLRKVFRDFWGRPKAVAVDGIDFNIRQGEIIGFLGPNGSGKSTTIKMMLGLLYPSAGALRVFDQAPTRVANKRRIGYLPEETYLYRYLTARETLDFFGALFNLPAHERRRRSDELLEMVGLSHAADRAVGEFSKGMARRIGLAQALVNDPDLVILDEPTSGLDPIGCRQVKEVIRLLAERKKTVILCSHLLADVEDVCDTVMIMYGGRIRARGKLSDMLTVEDRTRITTPALTKVQLSRVMAVLNEVVGPATSQVDRPTMSLEDFFMGVVQQAKAESQATSGAQSGGQIASYLTGAGHDRAAASQILAQLATPEPVAPPPAPAPAVPTAPAPDLGKLVTLTTDDAPPPAPAAPAPPPVETAADKAAKSKKLADLLKRG